MAVVNNIPFPQGVNLKGTPLNSSGEYLYDQQSSTGNGKQSLWQSRSGIELTGSYDGGKYEDYNNFDYIRWVDAIERWKHVQSDWSQTDECQSDFIRNKPVNVTQIVDGFMSKEDKRKLDGISGGAEKNVQSDWLQTNTGADDFIKNKPNLD